MVEQKVHEDEMTRELLSIFRKKSTVGKKNLNEDFQVPPAMNSNTGDIESFKSGISPNTKIETFNQNEGNTFVKGYVPLGNTKAKFTYDTTKTSPILELTGPVEMTDENTEILAKIGSYYDIWIDTLNKG